MTDQKPAAPEPPKPMPFAIMRNAHEAMRASIRLQEKHLGAGDLKSFREEWATFKRALDVHKAMEDRAMFALLDDVGGGAISAAKIPDEHTHDSLLATAVDAALEDANALPAAWKAWQADHVHHLEHEETVMMPLTMKTASTAEGRARVVNDRLLTPSETLPHFDWYIGWVVEMLSKHGATGQPAKVAVRVFAWGLQHSCTAQQWARFRPIVQRSCDEAMWAEMAREFGLDGEGAVG